MSRLPWILIALASVARADPDPAPPNASPAPPPPAPAPVPSPAPAPAPAPPPSPEASPPVRGQETIILIDERPRGGTGELTSADPAARDRRRALAFTSFVTVIHVDERAGETRGVAEAVGASVGADTRSLGGLGGFSSIAVRGAGAGQTQVSVDGVPVSRLGSVTADLSRFELDSFDEVELYRGAVPVTLGGAGVGGALDLRTRIGRAATGERWRLTLGGGSYGARGLRLRYGDGDPDVDRGVTASVGYAGATGDYRFFDDGGTMLAPDDDRIATRINNGYDQLDGLVRVGGVAGARRWQVGLRGLAKRQGVPGTGWAQAAHTRLDTVGGTLDGAVDVDEPGGHLGVTARGAGFVAIEAQAFRDPDDEIGVGAQDRRYLTLGAGGQGAVGWRRGRHHVAAALEGRGDRYRDREVGMAGTTTAGTRLGAALALGDDVGLTPRLALEPALRLEALRTAPLVDRTDTGAPAAPPRTELLTSPRLGARLLAADDLALKASVGRYARVPTALELFGDRGFFVGRPDLRTETGWAGDLGVVYAPAAAWRAIDRVFVEAAAFAARPVDVIAVVSTGGLVARPVNLPGADLRGVELSAGLRLARAVSLVGNYTFQDPVQRSAQGSLDGKLLPGRPRHAGYARVDVARVWRARQGSVYADLAYQAGSFLDEANLAAVPPRTLVGVGAKVELGGGVALGLEVKNLLDRRTETVALDPPPRPDLTAVPRAIADVAGFPLPGRALYLRLDVAR
ncbi:MAG: TonB-dependent receptor [Myxococcales bacterium]|nr:TonB-dependent receptor [Myxococcales bacterium]